MTRVNELINPITSDWDEQLIRDTFCHEDAEVILSLPIADGMEDWIAWHYDSAGRFLVKSVYKLAVQYRDSQNGNDASTSNVSTTSTSTFEWKKIWQLRLPNKVKMFLWRFAHNSLPVHRNLRQRE